PKLDVLADLALQNRGRPFDACRPVASPALRPIDERPFFHGSVARRKLLSGRTDGDVPRAYLLRSRRASHAVPSRLSQRGRAHEQHEAENPKHAHWSRSHRSRLSKVEWSCPARAR